MNTQLNPRKLDNLGKKRSQGRDTPPMNITLLVKRPRKLSIVELGARTVVFSLVFLAVMGGGILYGGYYIGQLYGGGAVSEQKSVLSFRSELQRQKSDVDNTLKVYRENMNALAIKVAQMQAQDLRMRALVKRVASSANLDYKEFKLDQPPAQGGPLTSEKQSQLEYEDLLTQLELLAKQLDNRESQLEILEDFILSNRMRNQVFPSGWPIQKGWISSYFGMRTDPFTGKRARHEGIDFAGNEDSPVVAVASGVIVFAGRKHGYGHVVEVNHGNGYLTRYAHNNANIVKTGEKVTKGQVLARMGSSGRSTGPHVHFEVVKDSRVVNPIKYIQASR